MKLPYRGIAPTRAHRDDAGLDLRAAEDKWLVPSSLHMVGTGTAVFVPRGHVGLLMARSSLCVRHGLMLANGVGVIDSGYHGEIKAPLVNISDQDAHVEAGERIAQLVIVPIAQVEPVEVEEFEESERGNDGFGSTGRD